MNSGIDLVGTMQHIADSAAQGKLPRVITLPEPNGAYGIFQPATGQFERMLPAPNARKITAGTLTGLVQVAKFYEGRQGAKVITVDEEKIVLHLDENDRREVCEMQLGGHDGFAALEVGGLVGVSQRDLLWKLRSLFNNDLTPATFIPAAKQMKFKSSSEGGSSVELGRESMGREISQAVYSATGALDESVTIHTDVFIGIPEVEARFEIPCAVDINVENQKFTIKPLPGVLDEAVCGAVGKIADWLRAKLPGVTVIENGSIV